MERSEQIRFDKLYKKHLTTLKLQGKRKSTVKTDRNGLQFFWKHVLGKQWDFIEIVKPPTVKQLPVILTTSEIERLLNEARKLRYYTILLTLYSMGLRLGEGLSLTINDIDSELMRVHLRSAKEARIAMLICRFVL